MPKTDLGYLGFQVLGIPTDRGSGRRDRRTAFTPPQELRTEHSVARTHREVAEATVVAARLAMTRKASITDRHAQGFWNHKSAPQAHFLEEKK